MALRSPLSVLLQGLWAALLILELFDPEFRALFKAKLAKVDDRLGSAMFPWIDVFIMRV